MFDGGGYYVQFLVRPETLEVYAEAVDLDAQGLGSLSDSERDMLARLGWTSGGENAGTANYHCVFQVETRDELTAKAAGALERTLRLVYGAGGASPLDLTVITYDKESKEECS